MRKIAKEKYEIEKSKITKRSFIERYLCTAKLLLNSAASLGDDVFEDVSTIFRFNLLEAEEVTFDED